ncbi:hypothetical protein PtrEW13061_012016 [Pyrenophora tritici-repentis]|nr:hypothetical protein PtrEW13061_012016 [Pyrenophora tritici-repentis]
MKDGPVFEARRIPSSSRLLPSSFLDWLRDALPQLLPPHVEGWLRRAFPVWFLPTRFIVKETNPAAPDSFYSEGKTYATLQHLQGRTIPIHYGVAEIEHPGETETHKAHLLELVDGIPLSECTMEQAIEFRSKEKINEALALLSEKNIVQGDPWPRHFIHTPKGELRIIDFGEAYETKNADELNRGDASNAISRVGFRETITP